MSFTGIFIFSALLAALPGGPLVYSAEFEVLDRFSVDGYSVFRGSADIPGGSFAVGGSIFVVKDGKVGIGTTAPGERLTITGAGASYVSGITTDGASQRGLIVRNSQAATTSGGTSPSIFLQNTSGTANNFASLAFAGSGTSIGYISGQITDHASSYGNLVFTTRGADGWNDRVIITSTGNVGIGTATPAATLDVGGTAAIKIPVGTTAQRPASPVAGMMRFNTDASKVEYYNGTSWGVAATGGNKIENIGGYRIHTFTGSGTFAVSSGGNIEVLVVAGGGGGGGPTYLGGGGGAGGLIYSSVFAVTPQSYSVTVGAGGAGGATGSGSSAWGANGGDSVFATMTAIGGGGGGNYNTGGGKAGGSGGGGAGKESVGIYTAGGAGTDGQGHKGGNGTDTAHGYCAGGGGGAGYAGADAPPGGNGGDGLSFSISGTPAYYAGGGGGTGYLSAHGTGGFGGGGTGSYSNGTSGTANTGGGGGGSERSGTVGGSGGSGIVIIRYPY